MERPLVHGGHASPSASPPQPRTAERHRVTDNEDLIKETWHSTGPGGATEQDEGVGTERQTRRERNRWREGMKRRKGLYSTLHSNASIREFAKHTSAGKQKGH